MRMLNRCLPLAIVLLIALTSCSGDGTQRLDSAAAKTLPLDASQQQNLLPELGQLAPAGRSASAQDLRQEATELLSGAPSAHVSVNAGDSEDLDFTPNYSGGGPLSGLAYGIYALDSSGYSGDTVLYAQWSTAPASGAAWIALANFASGRWEWHVLPDNGEIGLGAGFSTDYRDGSNRTVLAVVLSGSVAATLDYVRLGENIAPIPELTADPPSGGTADAFTLDASGSVDPDGTIENYTFFANDTLFDNGANPVLSGVHFSQPGDQFCVVTVTDNDGQQEQANVTIPLGSSPHPLLSAAPFTGNLGMLVDFDASGSSDDDGSIVKYEFDPENDGSFIDNGSDPLLPDYDYTTAGIYNAAVRVTDNDGHSDTGFTVVRVGWLRSVKGNGAGGSIRQILLDGSGNCYVCGVYDDGGTTNEDGMLLKYSANGELLWKRLQATPAVDDHDSISSMGFDSSGKLYVLGVSQGSPDLGQPYLAKLDPADGSIIWQRTLVRGMGFNVYGYYMSLALDSQDRIDIGFTFGNGGQDELVAAQYDSSGTLNWVDHWVSSTGSRQLGGLCVDDLDNLVLCAQSYADTDGSQNDIFTGSVDSAGNNRWAWHLDTKDGAFSNDDYPYGCCFSAGKVFVSGQSILSSGNSSNGLLFDLDSAGLASRIKYYQPELSGEEQTLGACSPDPGGGLLISATLKDTAGSTDTAVLHLDSELNLLLQRRFGLDGNNDQCYAAPLFGTDGALYFAGKFGSFSSVYNDMSGSLIDVPATQQSTAIVDVQTGNFADAAAAITLVDFMPSHLDSDGDFTTRFYP